ncbi:MAG TPA: ankyrin repeat domain-containing protein, partial [Candidatus Angelobacter sp.]|nr:ankyrin repeat domain-containing protein [Candidatus Angelobacter sp.]
GQTPLHLAACWGRKDIAELLLASGADVNPKDNTGATPLYYATVGPPPNEEVNGIAPPRENHPDVAKLLRKHGGLGSRQ